jgi:hypothetical protein
MQTALILETPNHPLTLAQSNLTERPLANQIYLISDFPTITAALLGIIACYAVKQSLYETFLAHQQSDRDEQIQKIE